MDLRLVSGCTELDPHRTVCWDLLFYNQWNAQITDTQISTMFKSSTIMFVNSNKGHKIICQIVRDDPNGCANKDI